VLCLKYYSIITISPTASELTDLISRLYDIQYLVTYWIPEAWFYFLFVESAEQFLYNI